MTTKTNFVTRIWVPRGNTRRLSEEFGVSMQTVRMALQYASVSNKRHETIRQAALERYGATKMKVPIKILV